VATESKLENREKLRDLLDKLGTTREDAAEILTKANPSGVSARSLRSWTCDPELSSARTCEDWVIKVLKKHLKERK
jgi:hypothetical protein